MEKLVEQLGITLLSKSQVSLMAKDFDAQVEAVRIQRLDVGRTHSSPPTSGT
jgi:putative transposase